MPRTIIDSQIHLWERESPDRPWPDYGRAYAHGAELTAEQALSRMDEPGEHRAVLVPPSWEGDRNDVCCAAARDYPDRFAVMGRFAVEDPSCRENLESWRETPGYSNSCPRCWISPAFPTSPSRRVVCPASSTNRTPIRRYNVPSSKW